MKLEDINKKLDVVLDYINKRKATGQLCRENGISSRTIRRWVKRYREGGITNLEYKSRTPKCHSNRTSGEIEDLVIKTKLEKPYYGSRMIKYLLGVNISHMTVSRILRRYNLTVKIKPKPQEYKRFERKHPDSMWQMDIYEFRIAEIGKVRLFNIEDDHSRYVCASTIFQRKTAVNAVQTLKNALSNGRTPREIYVDRGKQFISKVFRKVCEDNHVKLIVGRPFNPKARGKIEGFHKILWKELISQVHFRDLEHAQKEIDKFREYYNNKRPQGGIGYIPPARRYNKQKENS
jgi:transposase InsO family protein